ncbi:conserved Plasmodium membrane protein, unknown function [Plasmodium reichenowi]|uniref:Choline transporter-like protein n=1 Tax=Plasmodium reichenowi TaxID=5854 RepID=A0A2P9DPB4_PLARE|nr:conserved Plasmodium membrane protein, unknown function [Plasmodium reichenowi]
MNYIQMEEREYKPLLEEVDNGNNIIINNKEYYNMYENNNINNDNIDIHERVPLGTPLTYISGNPGNYIQHIDMYNVEEEKKGKKRLATDIKYFNYFVTYFMISLIIICYYFYYGKYSRILYGINYNGKICGNDLYKYPYLYFPLTPKNPKPEILSTYAKCLESCPSSNIVSKDIADLNKDKNKDKNKYFVESYFFSYKKKNNNNNNIVIDKRGNSATNIVYSDYTKSPNNNLYVEYSLNSPYYDTVNIMNICYPKDKLLREKVANIIFTDRYKTFVNLFSLHNSFIFIFLFVFTTIVLCFLYLLFLYISSTPTFHLFLISFVSLMFFLPIYFIHKHLYMIYNPVKTSLFSHQYFISIFICIIIFIQSIFFLSIFFIYKSTYKYTSQIIGITLNFIYKMTNIIYSPIIVSSISFIWFFVWLYIYIMIMTAGGVDEKRLRMELDSNGFSEIMPLQKFFYYFKSSSFFSILWVYSYFFICEILQNLNQFTINYLGTVWYFSDKSNFPKQNNVWKVMKTIINYHLGSLILSSFINLLFKPLRVIFFWTNSTLSLPFFYNHIIHKIKHNFYIFLKPISKIIDSYTSAAYCEMSISSYNYLFACDTSCKKLINSTSPAAALHGITYILNIIFPCFTTLIITFLSFNIFNNFQRYNDLYSSNFIPNPFFASLIIGTLCGIISSYFITLISSLSDCILYCFVCECYKNQMIDEDPMRNIFTPPMLRNFILEIYDEYNSNL